MASIYYTKRLERPHGRGRAKRPKTFKTEAAAKAYAEKQGIKDYIVENLRNKESYSTKFRVKAT